jgi:branched-chain amino acid transport system permease protein
MKALFAAAILLLVAFLMVFGDAYSLRLATMLAMYVALASGWNLIGGMAGYPSFATAAFFGLGAYSGAIAQQAGIAMPLAWVFAAVTPALLALAIGWVVLRLRGHYFAIASLAFLVVLRELATNWVDLTGGGMGLNLPVLASDIITQARLFFAAQFGVAAVAVATAARVSSGRLGFSLRCIRQNEQAAGMLGLDTRRAKAIAFALSAALAGPAGAIYASSVFYIEPGDVFDILLTVKPIIMAMLGGVGTVGGPVLGAAIFLALDEIVSKNLLSLHEAALGVLVVALALLLPRGLLGRRSA